MDKNDKQIMVVSTEKLLANYFQGFRFANEVDYEALILANLEYMTRKDAEINPTFKQPVPYAMVVNPTTKQVFVFQRANKDVHYGERRLQGKYSIGIGGHVERIDYLEGNPIHDSMLRELDEEVDIPGKKILNVLGYINDDLDDVGRVHFGILYTLETDATVIVPKDAEIADGRLMGLSELEQICLTPGIVMENWSRIAIEPLRKYLS